MSGRARIEQAFKLSNFVRELSLKNILTRTTLTKKQALRELVRRMYEI